MSTIPPGKLLPTVAMALLALFLCVKFYRNRHTDKVLLLSWMVISSLSSLTFNLYRILSPVTLPIYAVQVSALLLTLVFAYFGLYHYLNDNPYMNIFHMRLFRVVVIIGVVIILLSYFHQDSLESIGDDGRFVFSWQFFVSNIIFYSTLFYLELLVVYTYIANMKANTEITTFLVRRFICMVAFLVATIGNSLLMIINLFIFAFYTDIYFHDINVAFRVARTVCFVVFAIGMAMPNALLKHLAYPLERIRKARRKQYHQSLFFLRDILNTVVPGINRNIRDRVLRLYPALSQRETYYYAVIRCNTEINDARRIIWSYIDRTAPFTAKEEAEYIYRLLVDRMMFSEGGDHRPALPRYRSGDNNIASISQEDITRHNVAVARHLKKLLSVNSTVHNRNDRAYQG